MSHFCEGNCQFLNLWNHGQGNWALIDAEVSLQQHIWCYFLWNFAFVLFLVQSCKFVFYMRVLVILLISEKASASSTTSLSLDKSKIVIRWLTWSQNLVHVSYIYYCTILSLCLSQTYILLCQCKHAISEPSKKFTSSLNKDNCGFYHSVISFNSWYVFYWI